MPTVNFYLKKTADETEKQLIYLQFKYSGTKFVYAFGEKVYPGKWNGKMKGARKVYIGGDWDFEKQRVKSNKKTTADGQHSLNDLLDNLKALLEKTYKEEIKNGVPSKATLKTHLDAFFYKNLTDEATSKERSLFSLIERFIAGDIKAKGKDKSQSSLDNYSAVKKHLLDYQSKKKYRIDFDTITLDFFYSYVSFLKKYKWSKDPEKPPGLSQNTIAKDIRLLKVFMAEGIELGWTDNYQFKKKNFTVTDEDTDAVYLTEREVMKLYYHDLSAHKSFKKLDQVRDLFVVGCFTGLRYSDYSNIKPENIVRNDGQLYIKMVTQKTKELVIIPANPIVLEIFEKYHENDNRLPRSLSNQKFNDYIKDACEAAELNETGRLSSNPKLELYKCISSHTARRSFATNLYLEGFPVIDLMKITGHKTEKAFLKYIRVSKLDTAKRLLEHNKKKWETKIVQMKEAS